MTTVLPEAGFAQGSRRITRTLPRPTGTSSLTESSTGVPTTFSAVMLTADVRDLMSRVRVLSEDVQGTHADVLAHELSVRTQVTTRNDPLTLLNNLADMGFSWRGIARALGVSVPALQKWRRGEGVSGENRRKIATMAAGIDVIASQCTVEGIASWFETPISGDAPVTPLDLWSSGEFVLVLRYASGELSPESVLDLYEPSWREKWRSEFVAFRGSDGIVSLARRS